MLHVVTNGPKIKAQDKTEKQAAGYKRKNRFHRKLFQDLLISRLCDTRSPLIKKNSEGPVHLHEIQT